MGCRDKEAATEDTMSALMHSASNINPFETERINMLGTTQTSVGLMVHMTTGKNAAILKPAHLGGGGEGGGGENGGGEGGGGLQQQRTPYVSVDVAHLSS